MKVKTLFVGVMVLALGPLFGASAQEVQINKNRKLPPFPDLVVMRATYLEASHSVNVWVMNRAIGSKAGGCTLKLFGIRHKGMIVLEKLELAKSVPALAGGQSYTTTFDLPKPEGDVRNALSKVVVDSENVVHELKEANNVWSFLPKDVSARNYATRENGFIYPITAKEKGEAS